MTYPCILKLDGDDELIYLDSERELSSQCASLIFHDSDRLIDSNGQQFILQLEGNDNFNFMSDGSALTTAEVTELVQADQFAKAEVCLTKIQFKSVADAIKSLAD